MKVSLFGYNRKETDDYFNYLNETNSKQEEELEELREKLAEAEKNASEYKTVADLNTKEIEILNEKLAAESAAHEENGKLLAEKDREIAELNSQVDSLKNEIEELRTQAENKPDSSESDKLGFIFAVAYRDIENKNKAVSAKIREYAEMMFRRMTDYRNEVSSIVESVTEMQNRQKAELARLCEEASEKLDMLSSASSDTIEDMKKIEASKADICSEIENMLCETVKTDEKIVLPSEPAEKPNRKKLTDFLEK